MSLKIGRTAVLAATVAAVAALSVAAAPASAGTGVVSQKFENWVVGGSLTPKKLNEPVTLPEGSTFNGSAELKYTNNFEEAHGPVTGTVAVPPFNASLALLGILPTTVGVTFSEVGPSEGAIVSTQTPECPTSSGVLGCVNVSVLTKVNVGITMLGTSVGAGGASLGVGVTTQCETSEPIVFHLSSEVRLAALLVYGPQFTGTTTIPPLKCEGPEGLLLAPVLSAVMSGPDNAYALEITRPGLTRPKT
jgi:hypothetical protein